MRIRAAIGRYLREQTSLVSLVGNRIYHLRVPQDAALPALSYFMVSEVRGYCVSDVDGDARLPQARVQFDVYATTSALLDEVTEALREALTGARGTWGDVEVQGCFLEDSGRDEYWADPHGSDDGTRSISMDAIIHFVEVV